MVYKSHYGRVCFALLSEMQSSYSRKGRGGKEEREDKGEREKEKGVRKEGEAEKFL